jgi:hypothetical protein
MPNTKMLATITSIALVLVGWTVVHSTFWQWVIPGSLWSLFGTLTTSVIMPGFAWALWADLRERSQPDAS